MIRYKTKVLFRIIGITVLLLSIAYYKFIYVAWQQMKERVEMIETRLNALEEVVYPDYLKVCNCKGIRI